MGFVKIASVFDVFMMRGFAQFTTVFRSWLLIKNNLYLIRIAPMHSLNNDQYSGCWFDDKHHVTYSCLICQKHYHGKPFFHLNHHNSKV